MKPLLAAMFATLAAGIGATEPHDRAILAAMKLADVPNYGWTSRVNDDARSYTIEGRTRKDGCTWMRLPMVKSIALRFGRHAELEIEALFRGSDACVILTDAGWQTLRELPRRHWERNDDVALWPANPLGPGRGGRLHGNTAVSAPRTPFPFDDDRRPYSNAQFAICRPHDELAIIASSFAELNVSGELASGTLTDLGAQLLLVREGQEQLTPLAGAGTFRLLIKNGVVVRYDLRLEGVLLVDRKRVHVQQTSSTVVTNIGSTTFELPEEARAKLGL